MLLSDVSTAALPEFKRTTRSQTQSRFSNLPDPKSQKHISPQQNPTIDTPTGQPKKSRSYFIIQHPDII